METTTSEKPKKGMSGFSAFEIAISFLMLATLILPLGGVQLMGLSKVKLITFLQLLEGNTHFLLHFAYILPIANIIVNYFRRASWLSAITIYAAYLPIMAIDETGDAWIQVEPTFGYYLAWVNVVCMTCSVLISWLIFLGKKCTNYKRLFIISGIMVVVAPIVGFLLAKLLGLWSIFAVLLPFNILGIPLLIVAIISFFINHKSVEKISTPNEGIDTENSNTSKPWLNKKTGMIAGGVLVLVLMILGISKCGGTEEKIPLSECKIPLKDKNKLHTTDLDLFVLQGNVKTVVINQLRNEDVIEKLNIGFDKKGRITRIGDYAISYNRSNVGKVTNRQGQLVKRDVSNRVESIYVEAGCSGRQGFHFSYDVNGLSSYSEDTGECTGEEYYSGIEMEQGLIKGVTCTMSDVGINTQSTIRYTYLKFDENGNWIERRVTEDLVTEIEDYESENPEPKKTTDKYVYNEVREIVYY